MKFITHENFWPLRAAKLLSAFEPEHKLESYETLYEPGVHFEHLCEVLAKQGDPPAVLMLDDGISGNLVTKQLLDKTKMTFVIYDDHWLDMNWERVVAWRLIKCWPDVRQAALDSWQKHVRIEVGSTGRVRIVPL